MMKLKKKDRLEKLEELIKDEPFLTDDDLSQKFGVSIQTIRLDRMSLNIPEVRERVKNVATNNYDKVKTLGRSEIMGELIDIELNKRAISILQTDDSLAFEKTKIVKGHFIFAMAESLAMAVIDTHVALTGVANIKYRVPVIAGQKLVAKAELLRINGSEHIVRVYITVNNDQVFRGKFALVTVSVDK